MSLDELRKTVVYEDKTLEDLLKIVVEHSLEERKRALETFDDFKEVLTSADEWFMFGEKGAQYLKIANDATETINKMLGTLNKLKELDDNTEKLDTTSVDDLLDILEQNSIGPKRFFDDGEEEEKKEPTPERTKDE